MAVSLTFEIVNVEQRAVILAAAAQRDFQVVHNDDVCFTVHVDDAMAAYRFGVETAHVLLAVSRSTDAEG